MKAIELYLTHIYTTLTTITKSFPECSEFSSVTFGKDSLRPISSLVVPKSC